MASYELEELPSPSAFSPLASPRPPLPPKSPTTMAKKPKPDLSISTSFPSPSPSSSSSRTKTKTPEDHELEGQGQVSPIPDRIERRRSSLNRAARKRDTITVMGLVTNTKGPGYSRVPSNESDYTTPTTLGSLDLDAISPSSSHHHHHSPQTLHQKKVSRFRLRLLYTLIPVVSIALFALYTVIIIEHTQRKLMRKIQYPGLGGQAQALAQVATGSEAPQNLLGGVPGDGTVKGVEAGVEVGNGLGPVKTGADVNIGIGGGGGQPPGWKGVTVPPSEHSGPTILVPTGASITITDETPVPQPIPPPPVYYTPPTPPQKQEQNPPPPTAQTLPAVIPTSSLTIPGHPYPLSCGPDPATARAQNCIFDIMSYAWLPPPCYDHNLTTEFILQKSRSISLTTTKGSSKGAIKSGQTLSTGWRYYAQYSDSTPLDSSIVERGEMEAVYVTWEWHREHCLFMWRKLHRSLLVYGGGGDVLGDGTVGLQKGKEMMVDGYMGDYQHTLKCEDSLRAGEGIDGDTVNTMIRMKFPTCGVLAGGKR